MVIDMRTMTARQPKAVLACWVLPAQPEQNFFAFLIGELASRFDAPPFEPHVTIYAASSGSESPEGVMMAASSGCSPFRLTVRDLQSSGEFTKTVSVQFESSTALSEMNRKLREVSGANDEYELNPHLSLIYKRMTKEKRAQLAASIRLPFTEVLFDTVKAVVCPTTPIRSREDVENWRVVASQRLTG